MFKDVKTIVNKVVDTAAGPIETFDQSLREHPEELIPLAVIHLIPVALTIVGTVVVIRGGQQVCIEKERTKQAKLRAAHGCHHGHHGPRSPHGHHPKFVHHDELPLA